MQLKATVDSWCLPSKVAALHPKLEDIKFQIAFMDYCLSNVMQMEEKAIEAYHEDKLKKQLAAVRELRRKRY